MSHRMQSDNMTDLDNEEPLSNISDSSFIILGHGSLPPSINCETADEEFPEKGQNTFVVFESNKALCNKNTPTGSCDGQSFLEGDIQEKLKELIRENNQLKETLSQNNLAIKSQLNTFYMWQQEVLKTHETHKEKFLETKDLILKLRAENLSLKKQLTDGCSTINDDNLQISKKDDCDNLKQETEKLKSICEDLSSKNEILELENMKLRENLKATEKEVFKLSSELEDSMRESNFLKQKSDNLSKNSIGRLSQGIILNSDIQAQISNLLKKLETERSKTFQLKEKLKKANNIILKAQNLNMIKGVDEYLKSVVEVDCQNERFSTLQSWVTLEGENANQNSLGEIKEAKSDMCQKEKIYEQEQKNLLELKDQFNKLLEDYKALQEQLASIKNKNENEVSNLYQLLESKENDLVLKQQENDKLKEDIKKLNLQCEEVFILRAQVELYESDFNEERAARERLAGEKEEMAEQLIRLQNALEGLDEGFAKDQNEKQTKENRPFFAPYETKKGKFVCPKCMFSFSDYERCEEHVLECINIESYT